MMKIARTDNHIPDLLVCEELEQFRTLSWIAIPGI
jgi:hypothetical protein